MRAPDVNKNGESSGFDTQSYLRLTPGTFDATAGIWWNARSRFFLVLVSILLLNQLGWWFPFDNRATTDGRLLLIITREKTGHYDHSILQANKTIGLLLRGSVLLAFPVLESVRRIRGELSFQRGGKMNGLPCLVITNDRALSSTSSASACKEKASPEPSAATITITRKMDTL